MKQTALLPSIICAGALLTNNALATTVALNNYTFSSTCESVSSPANSGCSVSNGAGTGTVNFGLNGSGGPSVTASNASSDASGNTFGDLVYQILVEGPMATAKVDVGYLLTVSGEFTQPLGNDEAASITTGASLVVGPITIGSTSINVNAFGGSSENGFAPSLTDDSVNASYSNGAWSGLLSGPQTITLTTGLAYNVELRLQANCSGQGTGNSVISCNTSATVDPTFKIDPSQANAGQYSILFSSGLGNGTTAPEPGTMLLFGAGLVGLAAVARRRPQRLRT